VITPRRTIAVALVTLAAALSVPYVAGVITRLIAGCPCLNFGSSDYSHPIGHFSGAALTVAIGLGILLVRRAWPARGWTMRCLAAAQLFALVSAAGSVLAGVGAILPFPQTTGDFDTWNPHSVGEVLALGPFAILLLQCLVMLGVGILRALRPTTQPA
jgi:hypothetical protein